jgi:DNA-binding NarL/FixJ family response regulator
MNPTPKETRILLVDDHQIMRQGLRQLINAEPGLMVVGEAFDGQSAKDLVGTLAPDLVLMDIHLPDVNGVEVTRQILAQFPTIKIIALSSDAATELVLQALRAGISGYLIKENGFHELMQAISVVMDHRLYLSSEVSSAVITNFMKSAGSWEGGRAGGTLSEREQSLLQLIAAGKRNKEIAAALNVTIKSVETYRVRIQKKLRCHSTAELVRYAIREGIIQA